MNAPSNVQESTNHVMSWANDNKRGACTWFVNPAIPPDFHFKSRYPAMPHPNFPLPTFFLTLFNVLWFKEHGNDIKYNFNTLEYKTTKFRNNKWL
jgi:hypothetical protein